MSTIIATKYVSNPMAESNPALTEDSNQADSPGRIPLPYNWGKFQGWVMLVAGPLVELTRSGWLAFITVPLMVASGYAFAFRKRYAVTMTYVWIVLYIAVSLLGFVSAVTNDSLPTESRGYEVGQAIGTLLVGVGFWSLCAVYYHKRIPEFRLEAISKANKSNEVSSEPHKQEGPNRRVEEVRVKEGDAPEVSMNRKRKVCLLIGFFLLVLSLFFPPTHSYRPPSVAYSFLFTGQGPIDFGRLFAEWGLIALVIGGLFYALRGPDSPKPETSTGSVIRERSRRRLFWLWMAPYTLVAALGITSYGLFRKVRRLEGRIENLKVIAAELPPLGAPLHTLTVQEVLQADSQEHYPPDVWAAWVVLKGKDLDSCLGQLRRVREEAAKPN